MNISNSLTKIGGIILTSISTILLFGFFANFAERGFESSDWAALGFMVVLPMILGGRMIIKANKQNRLLTQSQTERMILQIAKELGGKLTAMELASQTKLSLGEATKTLEEIHLAGYTQIHHADNGAIIYEFADLLTANQKRDSERLL